MPALTSFGFYKELADRHATFLFDPNFPYTMRNFDNTAECALDGVVGVAYNKWKDTSSHIASRTSTNGPVIRDLGGFRGAETGTEPIRNLTGNAWAYGGLSPVPSQGCSVFWIGKFPPASVGIDDPAFNFSPNSAGTTFNIRPAGTGVLGFHLQNLAITPVAADTLHAIFYTITVPVFTDYGYPGTPPDYADWVTNNQWDWQEIVYVSNNQKVTLNHQRTAYADPFTPYFESGTPILTSVSTHRIYPIGGRRTTTKSGSDGNLLQNTTVASGVFNKTFTADDINFILRYYSQLTGMSYTPYA